MYLAKVTPAQLPPAEENDTVNALRLSQGAEPNVLADIYNDNVDITVWQRDLSPSLSKTVVEFIEADPTHSTSIVVSPNDAASAIYDAVGHVSSDEFCQDTAVLVDMFCTLFGVKEAGVRLTMLDKAMCPKFHVDRIPCRLITTYNGIGTEWLPSHLVDRSKLGHGSQGKADHESGLYRHEENIQQLSCGDVAILKGDLWQGSEGNGLVHRSPGVNEQHRLMLTIDMVS